MEIIDLDQIKYFVLHWIYLSMRQIPDAHRIAIEDAIITRFSEIRLDTNPIPDELLKIGKEAIKLFVRSYDQNRDANWAEDDDHNNIRPSPDFMKKRLAHTGALNVLLESRAAIIEDNRTNQLLDNRNVTGDYVKDALLVISPLPNQNNGGENS